MIPTRPGDLHDGHKALPNIHASKVFTQEELDDMIAGHALWQSSNGHSGERAYFSHAYWDGLDFRGADLSGAAFEFGSFVGANFKNCKMVACSFRSTDLENADLNSANIMRSNFIDSNLTNINLYETNFSMCIGNGKEIKNFYITKYLSTYTDRNYSTNCVVRTLEWWKDATLEDVIALDPTYLGDNTIVYDLLQIQLPLMEAAPCKATRYVNT